MDLRAAPHGPCGQPSITNRAAANSNQDLAANEVLVAVRYISVDPYMRIQQAVRDTYDAPHPLGIVQRAGTVGQVIGSASARFANGDWVLGYGGWQRYHKSHADELQKLDPAAAPVTTALGVLGMPGRTAWFGLMEAGRPKPGETLVVSGAAGAVGSLVAQFGKRAGCRVVGLPVGRTNAPLCWSGYRLDAAIDYRVHSEVTNDGCRDPAPCRRGGRVF